MRDEHSERSHRQTANNHDDCCTITYQSLAPSLDGTQRGAADHGKQGHRGCRLHRPTHARNQRRNRQHAAASTGDAHDQTDQHTENERYFHESVSVVGCL